MWSVPAVTTSTSQAFAPQPGAYLQLTQTGDLALWHPGQSSGASMWDAGTAGAQTFELQTDGNLVVRSASGTALWTSKTNADRGTFLCAGSTLQAGQQVGAWNTTSTAPSLPSNSILSMQADCNLVLYNAGTAVWASGTNVGGADTVNSPYFGCYATMQTDGNLVVYAPRNTAKTVLWASGTNQSTAPEAAPAVIGPYFLVPEVGLTSNNVCEFKIGEPSCYTPPTGSPNIYSFAGPLLGTPKPAKSGNVAQWIGRAFNTLVFFVGIPGDAVFGKGLAQAFTSLGVADTVGSSSTTLSGGVGQTSNSKPAPQTPAGSAQPQVAPVASCNGTSPSELLGGGLLDPGGCLKSANGLYILAMQTDGNLVLSDQNQSQVLWQANTAGNPGAYLRLQSDDGNLVLSNESTTAALWSSNTVGTADPMLVMQNDGNLVLYANGTGTKAPTPAWSTGTFSPGVTGCTTSSPSVLHGGQTLTMGGCLLSPNGQYELIMQNDGNLVIYYERSPDALWSTATSGSSGAYLRLQGDDGNLVLSNESGSAALWTSSTVGAANSNLLLQNDGNLVLYANNEKIGSGGVPYAAWASGTDNLRGIALPAGQVLQAGQYLQDGSYRLTMGTSGLLVLSQTTAASTTCPMWTMPTTSSAPGTTGTTYSYSGFPFGAASTPPTVGAYLEMQGDGNLVLYPPKAAPALFATGTSGSNSSLNLSSSGLLTVQSTSGKVLWQALPADDEGLMLCTGESISTGQYVSGDKPGNSVFGGTYGGEGGDSHLVMQSDCNLVLYSGPGVADWASDTAKTQAGQGKNPLSKDAEKTGDYTGCHLQMQSDGNLVMYAPNAPNGGVMWASNSEQPSSFSLVSNIGPFYVTTIGLQAEIYNDIGTLLWSGGPYGNVSGAAGETTAEVIFEILGVVAGLL